MAHERVKPEERLLKALGIDANDPEFLKLAKEVVEQFPNLRTRFFAAEFDVKLATELLRDKVEAVVQQRNNDSAKRIIAQFFGARFLEKSGAERGQLRSDIVAALEAGDVPTTILGDLAVAFPDVQPASPTADPIVNEARSRLITEEGAGAAGGPTQTTADGFTQTQLPDGSWLITTDLGQQFTIDAPDEASAHEQAVETLELQLLQQKVDRGAVSSTGTASRTEFASERELREAQTRLANAQTAGIVPAEERLGNRLSLDVARDLGQLGLDQSKFVADILQNPSDTLARLFFQRGEESPVPFVSQADLINRLREQFMATQDVAGLAGGGAAPAADVPTEISRLAPPPTAAPTTTAAAPVAVPTTDEFGRLEEDPLFRTGPAPNFAHGGSTQSRLLRVGEGGDEIIGNPTGAPLIVLNHEQAKKVPKKNIKGFQAGTLSESLFPESRLISGGEVTQPELAGLAEQGTGPGPRDVLAGRTPAPFRISGLPTPTFMNFSRLSGAERENLRPVLASKFNSTLEDLIFNIEQRFAPNPRLRSRARLVSR